MSKKFGIVLNGKIVKLSKTLEEVLQSQVYKPWSNSCTVYEFTYNAKGQPVDAKKVDEEVTPQ